MFCQECGKKNVKGAKFCEDCGVKLVSNNKDKVRKPFDKKTKMIFGFVLAIVIVSACCFAFLSNKFKPESIAKDYFLAVSSGNADKLYGYLNVDNSGFTSKKMFKKVADLSGQDIINYSISKVDSNALTSRVVINYIKKGDKTESSFVISLNKNKKNKFLFFDNWEISNDNFLLLSNVMITAPKDATVSIQNIKLTKKYLAKDSNDTYNKYVIPALLKGNYDVVVTLKNGLSLNSNININNINVDLTNLNVSKDEQTKIEKLLPDMINSLYQSATEKKAFSDIKKEYDYDGANLDGLEREYGYIVSGVNACGLTKLDVKNVNITSTKLNGSYVSVTAKFNYEYTVTKTWLGEERKNTKKVNDTIYLDFDYVNGKYKLVSISSFPKYFSLF